MRKMVVFQGMRLALAGVLLGIGAAFGLTRVMATFLFGVKERDLAVFIVVPILLSVVSFKKLPPEGRWKYTGSVREGKTEMPVYDRESQ